MQELIALKGETDKPIIIVGDFSTLLTIDRTTRYEIRKDRELSNTIKKQNLITVYIILHPIIAKYVYFSSVH